MLASAMVLRALIAALLSCASASLPAGAQAVAVPDCTVDGTLADDDEFIRLVDLKPPLPSAALRMPADHGERWLDRAGIRLEDTAQQSLRSAVARVGPSQRIARGNTWHSI